MFQPQELLKQFYSLIELAEIPDIRLAIISGDLSISEIWKIRQKRKGRKFRKWLQKEDTKTSRELEQAYVNVLGKSSLFNSLPSRAIRYLSIAAIGSLEPSLGIITGAADSFFLEKWLGGYSPRLFIDEIRKLPFNKSRNA